MSLKNLPPLATDTAYRAADFEYFEYSGAALTGSTAILRLHMKNSTTIDLPVSEESLKHLAAVLAAAFPEHVLQYFFSNGWAKRP
jgi:hypothetical protein